MEMRFYWYPESGAYFLIALVEFDDKLLLMVRYLMDG